MYVYYHPSACAITGGILMYISYSRGSYKTNYLCILLLIAIFKRKNYNDTQCNVRYNW